MTEGELVRGSLVEGALVLGVLVEGALVLGVVVEGALALGRGLMGQSLVVAHLGGKLTPQQSKLVKPKLQPCN